MSFRPLAALAKRLSSCAYRHEVVGNGCFNPLQIVSLSQRGTLAPICLVLAEPPSPHGSNGNFVLRVHCPQAVLLRRVLLMEQQVRI